MSSELTEYASKTLTILKQHNQDGNLANIFPQANQEQLHYLISDQLTYLVKKQLHEKKLDLKLLDEIEGILGEINQTPKLAKAYLETAQDLEPNQETIIIKRAAELFEKAHDAEGVIDSYMALGRNQIKQEDPDALHAFIAANIYSRNHKAPTPEIKRKLVQGLIEVSKLREKEDNTTQAYVSLTEAIQIAESLQDEDLIEITVLQKALLLRNQGETQAMMQLINNYPRIKEKYL